MAKLKGFGTKMADRERFEGEFQGEHVSIFRDACGHRFTDEEVEALLEGKTIMFMAGPSQKGNYWNAIMYIGKNDRGYWATILDGNKKPDVIFSVKPQWGHEFTREELDTLLAGERVHGHFKWKSGKESDCDCEFVYEDNERFTGWTIKPVFDND